MRRTATIAAILLAARAAAGGVVSERWAGKGVPATHAGTMKVVQAAGGAKLLFDLSAIPAAAKVHHASLYCSVQGGRQPVEPVLIHPAAAPGAALKLEPPWYASFDATEAVRQWVNQPGSNDGLTVARFDNFQLARTYLEVVYEGQGADLPVQAAAVHATHHHGQTFLAWTEHPEYQPKADETIWVSQFSERGDKLAEGPGDGAYGMPNHPAITLTVLRRLQGLAVRAQASGFQGIKDLRRAREVLPVTYRLYRHTERITPANIHQARRIAEVDPFSGLDTEVYAIHFQGEYINQREEPNSVIPTLCTDKGKALTPGEGLYVHTASKEGRSYYAVTTAVAGTENLRDITDANSLPEPVAETPGVAEPILQWVQQDRYHDDPPEYWYRYWAAPPYCNLPCKSLRVAVAVSEKFKPPGPLDIQTISGAFNVRGEIGLPKSDRIALHIQRQLDWLPALFYNEGRGTLRGMTESKVDYYCQRYMLRMIQWIMSRHEIDRSRISGSLLHFGLRHPEIFTRMSFGSYTVGYDLRWAPGGPSMPGVLGPRGIKTVTGEDAWKMYSVGEYVNAYPDRDIPFLVCISATGKDSGHTSEFGWQDDPRGWRGLIQGRQPFVASWSCGLPAELGQAFSKMRWDVSIPAFGNCSLDGNPGNGDPADGDYYGCINGWLIWSDTEQTDARDKWEMPVRLLPSAPADECTVDITPRHCKAFKPKPGQKFMWTNASAAGDDQLIQSGAVTADKWGLVTLKNVRVTKKRNRITVSN
ncbi:MAG TPA: hypothetical protein VFJ30_03255 [Phycisphaerae bacterium]|nr:hypothetical protein [Phycisphaerae bacterium]